jgi:sulfite reductase (NADPH) hemoprotein beta-component
MSENNKLSAVEIIKQKSDGLRGTLKESLLDETTGAIRDDDQALIKFHGMYQQDDRDRREERAAKKLDRLWSFMIRLRLPGGFLTPEQWIVMHDIAGKNTTGVIKITTRQTIQLHGLLKSKIKPTIKSFCAAKLDSVATCGDVNRNVLCSPNPAQSPLHREIYDYAARISNYLKPKTHAYYEIWLDEEKLADKSQEEDALYQDRYLPRKFKVGIAIPPNNDIDVLANDLGLIAIIENNQLKGFNIALGGGMGATHGNPDTYPRLATLIGFTEAGDKIMKVIYEVATVQRDFGNRSDRKQARLKYTLDRMGVDRFREELEKRTGFALEAPRPYRFTSRSDYYGWQQDAEGLWHYTIYIENGRVLDDDTLALKTALLEIAKTGKVNFRFTVNQNLILTDIKPADKVAVQQLLDQFGVTWHTETAKPTRKNAISCVALPTCPLALAESQRYFPVLLSKIELLLEKHGLQQEDIFIRMTGCPNGCARPHTAEIGFVGFAPGRYNLHLGGDRLGERMNTLYRENLDEQAILEELDGLFGSYSRERKKNESFGDYTARIKAVSV